MLPTIKSAQHNLFFNTALHFQEIISYASIINKPEVLKGLIQQSFISHAGGSVPIGRETGYRRDGRLLLHKVRLREVPSYGKPCNRETGT